MASGTQDTPGISRPTRLSRNLDHFLKPINDKHARLVAELRRCHGSAVTSSGEGRRGNVMAIHASILQRMETEIGKLSGVAGVMEKEKERGEVEDV